MVADANGDVNTARLISVSDDPAWKDDMGHLEGFINHQQHGADFHGQPRGSALEKFSAKFEAVPVAGTTRRLSTGAAKWTGTGRAHKTIDAGRSPPDTCLARRPPTCEQRHVPALEQAAAKDVERTAGRQAR